MDPHFLSLQPGDWATPLHTLLLCPGPGRAKGHLYALPHLSVPQGLLQLTDLGLYCVLVS